MASIAPNALLLLCISAGHPTKSNTPCLQSAPTRLSLGQLPSGHALRDMDRNSPSDDSDTGELPEEKRDSNIDTLSSSNTQIRGLNAADEAQLTAEEVAELRRARRRRNNRDSARRVRARRMEELAEMQRKVWTVYPAACRPVMTD